MDTAFWNDAAANSETIKEAEAKLAQDPKNVVLLEELAALYTNYFCHEKVISYATRAILLGHDNANVRMLRGQAHEQLMDENPDASQAAISDYEAAISFDPLNVDNMITLSQMQCLNHDANAGLATISKALMLEPNNSRALELRSLIYVDLKNYSAALHDAQKNISMLTEHKGLAYVNLAHIYCAMDNLAEAKASCMTALEHDNPCAPANILLIVIFLEEKNYVEALNHSNILLELNDQVAESYYYRALAYSGLSQKQQARLDFAKCLELEPGYKDAEEQMQALEHDDVLENELNAVKPEAVQLWRQAQKILSTDNASKSELLRAVAILDNAIGVQRSKRNK